MNEFIAPAPFLSPAAYGPGFLGPQFAPLMIGNAGYGFGQARTYESMLKVADLMPPSEISEKQADARLELVRDLQSAFVGKHPGMSTASHREAYERVFGALPGALENLQRFPADGKPKAAPTPMDPMPADGAWEAMSDEDRATVNAILVNYGKAIAAFLRTLVSRDAPFSVARACPSVSRRHRLR